MRLGYPATRVEESVDTLCGVSFPDPYRWLEQDTDEVRIWQRAQAELASRQVRQWAHFDQLRQQVAQFNTERYVNLPRFAGGLWFRTQVVPGASQAQALVSEAAMGEGRVLFDPRTENAERPPFVSWIAPSPDGRTLALGVCVDGSENNTTRLIDVATGQRLKAPPPQTLMDNWTGGVHWLPDSSGFFFSAITSSAVEFVQEVFLHRRVPTPTTTRVAIPWTEDKEWRMVVVSADGRYAVALERFRNPIPVAYAELGNATLLWRPFVTSVANTLAGYLVDRRFIAITDAGAGRGRLVSVALDSPTPNDPHTWQELLPESDATLRTVTLVGSVLYLTEFVNTYGRVRVVDLSGNVLDEVSLPGRGSVSELPYPLMNLIPKGHPEQFIFGFSSFTQSPGIYCHRPDSPGIETLRPPQVQLSHARVEDRWATSSDGTRIPYHVVRPHGAPDHQPLPTLIYAYGGFNVPLPPQFPGVMAAFVAAGGVFVHAHLRGGGEFGRDWWLGGRLRNKQNCYQDLYAIAEDLIESGIATRQSLAVTGNSNGGLMSGVALTQRPDLWQVVVPRVPFLDCIGGCRDPYGRMAVKMEMADVDDAEEVRRLSEFSPYQLVREGVNYPAVYIDAGNTDPRCPPWHARKFAARLQAANAGSRPILLHVWENVGHGWATDKAIAVEEHAEWLGFTMHHLGLRWPADASLA